MDGSTSNFHFLKKARLQSFPLLTHIHQTSRTVQLIQFTLPERGHLGMGSNSKYSSRGDVVKPLLKGCLTGQLHALFKEEWMPLLKGCLTGKPLEDLARSDDPILKKLLALRLPKDIPNKTVFFLLLHFSYLSQPLWAQQYVFVSIYSIKLIIIGIYMRRSLFDLVNIPTSTLYYMCPLLQLNLNGLSFLSSC